MEQSRLISLRISTGTMLILYDLQHGFRESSDLSISQFTVPGERRSYETAGYLSSGHQSDLILLDLCKTFDKVSPQGVRPQP